MEMDSQGQRIAASKASELHISPLEDQSIINSLTTLRDLFVTSLGTKGHGKVIHNDCGGQVTLTSDCGRLVETLSISKPVLKMVILAIKDHVHMYSDAGMLAMIFSLTLIVDALRLDIHRRLVIDVYNITLKECMKFMESNQFLLKLNVKPNDVAMQRKLVLNMYKSKPVCLLFGHDLDHLCHLTLTGYRKCNNSRHSSAGDVSLVYITIDGRPPCESKLLGGVLYESPQIPTYRNAPLVVRRNNENNISVALVQTSMAGDTESFLDVTYELASDLDVSATILTQLELFTDAVVGAGVGVLICQKVIHPKLKKILKQSGLLVIDRLGRVLFDAVCKLAGGPVLDPFSSSSRWHFTSMLNKMHHIVINNKSYIHMEKALHEEDLSTTEPNSLVYTVLLCHRTEQALQEMKTVYERCQHVLSLTSKVLKVLCGGGCWQSAVCLHLINKIPDLIDQWTDQIGCTKLQMRQILEMFASALAKTAVALDQEDLSCHLVDLQTGHHFVSDMIDSNVSGLVCQCGAVSYDTKDELDYVHLGFSTMGQEHIGKSQRIGQEQLEMGQTMEIDGFVSTGIFAHDQSAPVDRSDSCESQRLNMKPSNIIDAYLPALNSLKTAVSVSSMVLGIQNYVKDVN